MNSPGERRQARNHLEAAFNDYLATIWESEYDPTQITFVMPLDIAKSTFRLPVMTNEFLYQSDFGDIHIRIRDEDKSTFTN